MPTLPLYDPKPAHPNASHRVAAPGGYEWWHFDADDAAQDVQVVVTFALGGDANADYLRRYHRYRRRPTRYAPPVPADYPSVSVAVYERGRAVSKFSEQVPPPQFAASIERLDVKAGAGSVAEQADGSILVRAGGADLTFHPLLPHPPYECWLWSRRVTRAVHKWVVAAPLCAAGGTIRLDGSRVIQLTGRGYHDHQYGTAPLGDVRRWFIRGRTLGDDRASGSFLAYASEESNLAELCTVQADQSGVHVLRGIFGGDLLSGARFLDRTRWTRESEGDGANGRALYERIAPTRPGWPFGRRVTPAPAAPS